MVVRLNVVANDSRWCANYPPTVLLHGMDSSSLTWKGLLEDLANLKLRALSIDQRGCGLSPLGNPNNFTPEALADDLLAVLAANPLFRLSEEKASTKTNDTRNTTSSRNTTIATSSSIRPFVLVGHSMGGRIAMSFAAKYPELIHALVIEDMDIRKRRMVDRRLRCNRARTMAFDRNLPGITTKQEVIDKFVNEEGYLAEQVHLWLDEEKVEAVGVTVGGSKRQSYYSQVHPAFRRLCWEQFFETSHGEDTWNEIADILRISSNKHKFDVHLMVADPAGTVCDEGSITNMVKAFRDRPDLLQIHRYPGASHSIHNSKPDDFTRDLEKIICGFTSTEEEKRRKAKEDWKNFLAGIGGAKNRKGSRLEKIYVENSKATQEANTKEGEAKKKAVQEANIKAAVRSLEENEEEAKKKSMQETNIKAAARSLEGDEGEAKKKSTLQKPNRKAAVRSSNLWSSQNYRQSVTGASEHLNIPT